VTFFGDIEFIQYDSYHRNIKGGTCPAGSSNCFNPNSPPTANAYNWDATNKDKNWALGIGTDWKAMERLTLGLGELVADLGERRHRVAEQFRQPDPDSSARAT
jgi:hypothetical protein